MWPTPSSIYCIFFPLKKKQKHVFFVYSKEDECTVRARVQLLLLKSAGQGAAHPRAEGQYSYLGFIQTIKTRLDVRFQDDKCCWDKVQPGQINTV